MNGKPCEGEARETKVCKKERVLGGRWEYPEDEGHGLREPVPPGWMANRPEDEGGGSEER